MAEPRKPRRTRSVRTRITLVAVAVVAALLGIGAVGTVWTIDRVLTDQIAAQLDDDLDMIADTVESGESDAITDRDDDVLIALHTGGRTIVNDDDASELPSPDEISERAEARVDDEPMLILTEELGGDRGTLVIARSTEEVGDAVSAATMVLAVAVPIAVALIGVVVWAVAARALGPVERIRRQVDQVGADSLDQRVPRTGNDDEIDRLAATMNRMLDRVEDGYRTRQRFVSDASHELRSPLATMRQYAELERAHPGAAPPGELADVVLGEGARMQEIVEGLLLLAKLDEGSAQSGARGDVDLDDLALAEASRIRSSARPPSTAAASAPHGSAETRDSSLAPCETWSTTRYVTRAAPSRSARRSMVDRRCSGSTTTGTACPSRSGSASSNASPASMRRAHATPGAAGSDWRSSRRSCALTADPCGWRPLPSAGRAS